MNITLTSSDSRRIALLVIIACLALCAVARAARIKDLVIVEGGRDNQLVGYGLVVGILSTGLVVVLGIAGAFVYYNNDKIKKVRGREQAALQSTT